MVRNGNGTILVYKKEPHRYVDYDSREWTSDGEGDYTSINLCDIFSSIRWSDEPVYIRDIYDPQILTKNEKQYLENVIKPFKDRVDNIRKYSHKEYEYICIDIINDYNILLPKFKIGEKYCGMQTGISYTIDLLRLFDEE